MGPPETESFCKAKDMINKTKRQPTECENLQEPHIRQRADIQNIQRTQEIGHQKYK